jgi:sugar phosphate isomerase/epimerase
VQFAFSTNAFKNFSLEYAIRSIAKTGYKGVEILCDIPHAYPPDFGDEKIKATRQLLSELGIQVSNLNAFTLYALGDVYHPSWIESDERQRNDRLQHTLNCITLAKRIGARNLSTEPGGPVADPSRASKSTLEKIFLRNVMAAEKLARSEGIKILIEPEPGLLVENSTQFLNFIKDIPSEYVGLNFDIGHFFCVREDPEELIYKLSDHIGHFHIEDIAANRVHEHLIPGRGAIDFKSVLGAIDGIGYDGFVTVELYPYQDDPVSAAREAFEYLNRNVT